MGGGMEISFRGCGRWLAGWVVALPLLMTMAGAQEAAPVVPVDKEHATGLEIRARLLPKLPTGAVVVYDQPYVAAPLQGTRAASSQKLDLYVPPGEGPFPLVFWIHGGAWKGGSKEPQGADLAVRWLPKGFAVAAVNYRFLTDRATHPSMIQDCHAALAWLRTRSAEYHLDPDRVGVMGASAGAHIAGMFALTEGSGSHGLDGRPVRAAVLWCGFYDMTKETGGWGENGFVVNPRDDFSWIYPNRTYDPAIGREISPVYLIGKRTPPVLLGHGEKDPIAPIRQSELFAAALEKAERPVAFKRYPEFDHNLFRQAALDDALAFFEKELRGK